MAELMAEDPAAFRNFTRIGPDMFHELLQVVGPRITKNHNWFRQSINPDLKFAITLRFLAIGNSYRTLMYWLRVAHNTICSIVRDVCEAIVSAYAGGVIQTPTGPEEWKAIADQFAAKWQFPHAIGALDGKACTSSHYFCYALFLPLACSLFGRHFMYDNTRGCGRNVQS